MIDARTLLLYALFCLPLVPTISAQNDQKKPQTWEEKKARLQVISEEKKEDLRAASPQTATANPSVDRRILVFWRCEGFVHGSIPTGNAALEALGKVTGAFAADFADDYSVFESENLAKYDLILFNNTTRLTFPNPTHRQAVLDFLAQGKGVAGIHAASDNFANWAEGLQMMGGIFNGHPWNAGGTWAFKLEDAEHPLNASFNNQGFWLKDEIYQYKPESFVGDENLRVLVSLDMTKSPNIAVLLKSKKKGKEPEAKTEEEAKARRVPVSWIREFKGGRVFYSNLGHNDSTYYNTAVLQHYLDGIQYALGDLSADATPSANMEDLKVQLAPDELPQ
ncbi:MAG: ThuA domain-containing protein [Verrucomicrobiota bacterium]